MNGDTYWHVFLFVVANFNMISLKNQSACFHS